MLFECFMNLFELVSSRLREIVVNKMNTILPNHSQVRQLFVLTFVCIFISLGKNSNIGDILQVYRYLLYSELMY